MSAPAPPRPAADRRRGPLVPIALVALVLGAFAARHYAAVDLTLSHYDARGHLVVSRRILDSITPGWQQIGAVWLPLPHLLAAVPVQVDALYRSGLFGVAVSVLSYSASAAAIAWLVAFFTGSWAAAAAGAAVFMLNPNVLYLQATPMTEPLLLALLLVGVAGLVRWCADGAAPAPTAARPHVQDAAPPPRHVGVLLALACLTRYEAWPVTAGALTVGAWVRWRKGDSATDAVRALLPVAVYPVGAIAAFTLFSRIVVGSWFASGFFVPENPAQGNPYVATTQIVWGLRELSGAALLAVAAVGLALLAWRSIARSDGGLALLPLTLLGTAAVPWVAFFDGHPYRIRYMVPLIAAQALLAGVAAGGWRRTRVLGALALAAIVGTELRPLDAQAPMVLEAQWDRPNAAVRQRVTACLRAGYGGETVMASMGSLGHYMQDLSRAGFRIRDFLHEGNGDIWLNALYAPRPFAGWILIEEKAEGGDMLAAIARERPAFLEGYRRVCEGAGLALYRREPPAGPARARVGARN